MKNLLLSTIMAFAVTFSFAQQNTSPLNSKNDELHPVFHPNGNQIYFTRAYDSLNIGGKSDGGDIYVAELLSDGSWSQSKNVGEPLNNRFTNAILGFTPDGKVVFLHNHYPTNDKPPRSQGISYAVWNGKRWSFPKPVEIAYFKNNSDHQSGSLSADGSILLLAIDSYSSRGHEDIYVSFWDGENFGQPKNLGDVINTERQEMTPVLAPDNKTLFFSSNGFKGMGGRDIYKSERLDDSWTNWSKPENLGSAVNTEGVELSFIIYNNMEWGLYTSTQNSDGYGDLKYFKMPEDSVFEKANVQDTIEIITKPTTNEKLAVAEKIISGRIYNEKTRDFIDAGILLKKGKFTDSIQVKKSVREFKVSVPDSLERIFIEVRAKGFMPVTETIVLDKQLTERIYYLTPLEVGTTIKLDRIYFERGSAELIDSSYTELDKVVEVMKENKSMKIELAGHTDNQGDSDKNLELSKERVDAVKAYLTSKGIAPERIDGKGYGGARPIASNASEETRKLNRRVEFKVTDF